MAILGARGWECGNSMLNSADATSAVYASNSSSQTGSYSLEFNCVYSQSARWAISGSPSNPSVSLWMYARNFYDSNGYIRIKFLLGTGEYIELRWNSGTHTFDAYVDGALAKAGTVEVSVNTWFNVELYVVVADAGNIGVKINGHQSIDWSCDTQPGIATGATYVYITCSATSHNNYMNTDDLVWGSGGYLGAKEVYDKLAASDDTVAWTPLTGAANYAMEDEVPPSDADYNETAVTATVDKLGLAALSLTDRVVDAVIAWSRAADPDAHGSSIIVGIDSNGTESTATTALAAGFEYYWGGVDAVNPDGPAAWNQASIDALLHMKKSVIP